LIESERVSLESRGAEAAVGCIQRRAYFRDFVILTKTLNYVNSGDSKGNQEYSLRRTGAKVASVKTSIVSIALAS